MANRAVFRFLKNSSGVELNALSVTTSFASETIDAKDYDEIGLLYDCNTIAGTASTVTANLQISPDGGTTWLNAFPAAGVQHTLYIQSASTVSNTPVLQASVDVAPGVASEGMKFWENPIPETGKGSLDPKVRFNFLLTTITAFTANVWLVLRNRHRL